ncbi:hypothetical protein HQ584_10220 [Patescibacteria group bacterium]|nr:hypothetical protein [Patescibacteria group bacterium]
MSEEAVLEGIEQIEEIELKTLTSVTNVQEQSLLWDIYHCTFGENKICAQDQRCYNKIAFKKALEDSDYIKFILYKDGFIVGFCLATNKLEKARVAYINPDFFKFRYPKFSKEGRIYYITALCILPQTHTIRGLKFLLNSMIYYVNEREAIVAFDFSENKNKFLPKLAKVLGESADVPVVGNRLDAQTYFELYGLHNAKPE